MHAWQLHTLPEVTKIKEHIPLTSAHPSQFISQIKQIQEDLRRHHPSFPDIYSRIKKWYRETLINLFNIVCRTEHSVTCRILIVRDCREIVTSIAYPVLFSNLININEITINTQGWTFPFTDTKYDSLRIKITLIFPVTTYLHHSRLTWHAWVNDWIYVWELPIFSFDL